MAKLLWLSALFQSTLQCRNRPRLIRNMTFRDTPWESNKDISEMTEILTNALLYSANQAA
jgi:hypothetical protein